MSRAQAEALVRMAISYPAWAAYFMAAHSEHVTLHGRHTASGLDDWSVV